MRSVYAQQKDYFDFGVRERLRAFLDPTFTAGVVVAVQVLLSAVTAEEGVYSEINQQQSSR